MKKSNLQPNVLMDYEKLEGGEENQGNPLKQGRAEHYRQKAKGSKKKKCNKRQLKIGFVKEYLLACRFVYFSHQRFIAVKLQCINARMLLFW